MSIQRWTITGGDIAPAEADAAQTDWVRWVDHQAAVFAARADEREWWYAETVSGYDRGVHDAQLEAYATAASAVRDLAWFGGDGPVWNEALQHAIEAIEKLGSKALQGTTTTSQEVEARPL